MMQNKIDMIINKIACVAMWLILFVLEIGYYILCIPDLIKFIVSLKKNKI